MKARVGTKSFSAAARGDNATRAFFVVPSRDYRWRWTYTGKRGADVPRLQPTIAPRAITAEKSQCRNFTVRGENTSIIGDSNICISAGATAYGDGR